MDIKNMMKQLQDVQQQMENSQKEVQEHEETGQSGAGLVKVTMNGRHDVKRVELDDTVMSEDKEFLEDLIAAAVNDAVRKIETFQKENAPDLASQLPLPPGFKLPF